MAREACSRCLAALATTMQRWPRCPMDTCLSQATCTQDSLVTNSMVSTSRCTRNSSFSESVPSTKTRSRFRLLAQLPKESIKRKALTRTNLLKKVLRSRTESIACTSLTTSLSKIWVTATTQGMKSMQLTQISSTRRRLTRIRQLSRASLFTTLLLISRKMATLQLLSTPVRVPCVSTWHLFPASLSPTATP